MTILTLQSSISRGNYRTSGTVSAFTPNASRILIGVVALTSTGVTVSGITGHGTWTRIRTLSGSGSQLEIWACKTSASPSSSAVTVSHDSCNSWFAVYEVSSSFGDTTAAGAFIQSGTFSVYATGTPPDHDISVTLSNFADATNNAAVIFAFLVGSSTTWTNQGTLATEYNYQTSPYCIQISSCVGQDTSPGVTSTQDYCLYVAIAVELKSAGGGTNSFSYTASGGLTVSGAATKARVRTKSSAGGVQMAGAASVTSSGTQHFSYSASGGLQLGGTGAQLRKRTSLPSGGVVLAGASSLSTHEASRTVTPSGGLVISGNAAEQSQTAGGSSNSDIILRRRRRI